MEGLSGLRRAHARASGGISSFMISSRLALSSAIKKDEPVMFPPGRARLNTSPVWVPNYSHNYWNRGGRLLSCEGRGGALGNDDSDPVLDKVCCERRKTIVSALCPAIF